MEIFWLPVVSSLWNLIGIPKKCGPSIFLRIKSIMVLLPPRHREDLKMEISKVLPYYMIPSDVIVLEKFPYNANHKIDKNQLINIYRGL